MSEYALDRLPNGLRLVTVAMPHLHCAEMLCYVGVGARHEEEETAGVSHFLEHMVFRGTADYPTSLHLEQAFEALGGMVNALTDAETTCFHSRLHPERLAEGAALFASMLRRPLLADLDVERRIILEEALEDYNERGEEINPDTLTARLLWPAHPLSLPTIGTRRSIETLDAVALRRHFERFYAPHNTVIAVAGPMERTAVLAAVTESFADWSGPATPQPLPWQGGAPAGPQQIWVKDSDSQVSLQLAFRLPGRHDPRAMALRLLRRVLSGGGASRLMLRLREQLGLTYNVEANLALFADSGCLAVDLAVAPEKLLTALEEVLKVLADLKRTEMGSDELERVVRGYLYDLDFSRDHTDELAVRYGWGELVGCLRTLEDDRREALGLTTAQLRAVAQELLSTNQLSLAVVGPWRAGDRRAAAKLLERFEGM